MTSAASAATASDSSPGRGAELGGGLYRLASRLADHWVYLPLALRSH